MDNDEYKELFISEAKDILTLLNQRLVDLEKQPDDRDCLHEIFRQAHTLKGMAATMGYNEITKLTHEMEGVLDLLRRGVLKADKSTVELLFDSFDALEGLVGEGAGEKNIDTTELIGKLKAMKAGHENISVPLEKDKRTNLRLEETDRLEIAEKERQGFKTYRLVVSLSADCAPREPRVLVVVKAIEDLGKVIRKEYLYKQLESGKFGRHFGVFFISKENPDLIKEKIEAIADVEKVILKTLGMDEVFLSVKAQAQQSKRPFENLKEGLKEKDEAGLRTQMVKVPLNKLDDLMDEVGELVINKIRLASIARELTHKPLDESITHINRLTDELQVRIMDIRLIPMDYIFNRFPRLVRDVAVQEEKDVDFMIEGADIGLDRNILDEINEPIMHLLKNAVSHGIELPEHRKKLGKDPVGKVKLSARRERAFVLIEIYDDGKGIDLQQVRKTAVNSGLISNDEVEKLSDEDTLMLITLPGFSTSKVVTETSGRGVGMNSAKTKVALFGGELIIKSRINEGSRFILRLPLSMAITQALLVGVGTETYAIPLVNIAETIKIEPEIIKIVEHHEVIPYREEVLPLIRLKEKFGFSHEQVDEMNVRIPLVIVEVGRKKAGLVVDKLLGQQEVVIKSLTDPLKSMKGLAGATILGNGKVATIIDVASII